MKLDVQFHKKYCIPSFVQGIRNKNLSCNNLLFMARFGYQGPTEFIAKSRDLSSWLFAQPPI